MSTFAHAARAHDRASRHGRLNGYSRGREHNINRISRVLVLAVVLCAAIVASFATQASAALTYQNDENGVNDQPGQKDLTRHGVDASGLPTSLQVAWNWDTIGLNGANTGDACALFDTDADGKINYALCVTIAGDPAAPTDTRLYSCGDDKVDRCTTPIAAILAFGSSCTVAQTATDPFSPSGESYPNDTTATCSVLMADFGLAFSAKLVNTCSYPSQQPNSDPSDCVLIKRDGFLIIDKQAEPDESSAQFNFTMDGSSEVVFTAHGSETSGIIPVRTDRMHSILESMPDTWLLDGATCSNESGTREGDGLIELDVDADQTVTCTFVNQRKPSSLTVIKHVVNDNSGSSSAADFSLHVLSGDSDVIGSPQPGDETGTVYVLAPGDYSVGEDAMDGYSSGYSGDCASDGSVTLAAGQDLTCTITNDDVPHPAIMVTKTVDKPVVHAGDEVTYTILVENTGDDPLTGISVDDPDCSPIDFDDVDEGSIDVLDVGETWQYKCSTTIGDDIVNTATAEGYGTERERVSDDDDAAVDVINPSIHVSKSASSTVIHAGDSVTYTVNVKNDGDVPLTDVKVDDPNCSPLTFVSSDGNDDAVLDSEETWTYTCTTAVNDDTTNTATAEGIDPIEGTVKDDDSAKVDVINPSIHVRKTADQTTVLVGTVVKFTVEVENNGDVPLFNVKVSDTICSPLTFVSGDAGTVGVMEPSEVWIYTCSMAINSNTVNVATASALTPQEETVTDNASATVNVTTPPTVQALATPPSVTLSGFNRCVSRRFTLAPSISGGTAVSTVLYIDGKRRGSTTSSAPRFTINGTRYKSGTHRVKMVVTLSNGQTITTTGSFSRCKLRTVKKISPKFTG
ncbi:MAG: DUF11 domain-containing protein [Actinobacteria bacterium]|nr:DUF11 domain-containing protein [Actinomycetota bacterium]